MYLSTCKRETPENREGGVYLSTCKRETPENLEGVCICPHAREGHPETARVCLPVCMQHHEYKDRRTMWVSSVDLDMTMSTRQRAIANEMAMLCEDVRERVITQTINAQDMLFTVQGGHDEVVFFVRRNMSDPPWHVRLTMVSFDRRTTLTVRNEPIGEPYTNEMLARNKQTLVRMLRCYFEYEFAECEDIYCASYHQGVDKPPSLMPRVADPDSQWFPFSTSALSLVYDTGDYAEEEHSKRLDAFLEAIVTDIEVLLATA